MLKDLIRNKERNGYVIPLLNEAALKNGYKDTQRRRRDCFHPSEISIGLCPRAWLLGLKYPDMYSENQPGERLQWIFDTGTELHELVQKRLGSTGKLFGIWKCQRWCKEKRCTHYGFEPKMKCPMGYTNREKWSYEEVPVIDDELEICGRTDGVVILPKGKHIFEFKTMNSRVFATLAEPIDMHKEQAAWYLDVLSRNSYKVEAELERLIEEGQDFTEELEVQRQPFRGTVIVYMNKDTQEFREFRIREQGPLVMPDSIKIRGLDFDSEEECELEEKKELMRKTLVMRDEGIMAERLDECLMKSSKRARNCYAKDYCFSKEES